MTESPNYEEVPAPASQHASVKYVAFFAAWLVSIIPTFMLADAITMYTKGHHSDGGGPLIACLAVIPALHIFKFYSISRVATAALLGFLCAPVTVFAMYGSIILIADLIRE